MEETGLVLRPFINGWIVLTLGAAAVVLSAAGYARTTRSIPRRTKLLLIGLRVGAVAVLMACLLRPSLQMTHYELVRRPLVLLVDQSLSMRDISDTPEGLSRLEAVNRLLKANEAELAELAEDYEVAVLGFGRGLLSRAGAQTGARYSAYGLALQQAFAEAAEGRADAVVLLGDGSHNYGPPDPMDVAASLNEQGVPLYTVGVGQGQATSELRDTKVVDVDAPKSAFLFTHFKVRPQVLCRGCEGVPVKVSLRFGEQEPQERILTVTHSEEMVPFEFDVLPQKVGEHRVAVRVEPVPNEILDTNNSFTTYVRVVSGGVRVGFFDTVRPESKFVARALSGAEHLRVLRVLVLPGRGLPREQTDPDRYDVFILGEVSGTSVQPSRLLAIRRAVQQEGKGLVLLLTQSTGGEGWRRTSLEDLLPVRLGPSVGQAEGSRRFVVPPEHADHPILELAEEPQRRQAAWADLPPLAGAVTGVQPKRGAIVLARDDEGAPLLVVQRSGAGRVACVMADTTFRWFFTERNTQDRHRRFWRQLVMWAAGRKEDREARLRLALSRQRLLVDEELKMLVHLTDADGEVVRDADVSLRVTDPRDETRELPLSFSRPEGAYAAAYSPSRAGDYTVVAQATRQEQDLGSDRSHFHASSLNVELEDPIANPGLLRRMAAATAEAGGRYYFYSQAGELFEQLRRGGEPLKLTTRRRRDIWDGWPLFALFAACVVAEWSIRKRKGLV
jgi:hypothetical protein